MKQLLTFWLLLMAAVGTPSMSSAAESLLLSVGQEKAIELTSLAKTVDIGDVSVISVRRGSSKATLFVRGKRTGSSSLTISLQSGTTLTYQVSVGNRLQDIAAQLRKIPGIGVSETGGKITVQGTIRNRRDQVSLQKIKSDYPGLVVDATEANFATNNTIVSTINDILRENDMANVQAAAYGRLIVLEGSPKDEAQAELAMRIASMVHSSIENRMSKSSKGGPAIAIEVVFVEVSKSNDKNVGFSPQLTGGKTVEGGTLGGLGINTKSGTVSKGDMTLNWQVGGLATFLQMVQTRAYSRVLSNPRLVTRSGEEAKFHSGQTFYVKDTKLVMDKSDTGEGKMGYVNTMTAIETGIILQIDAKLDSLSQIDSKIVTSVSEMGTMKQADAIDVLKSEVKTAVTIKDGQTIMLSGLVRKENKKTVERVPVLADIPLLGELFKSRKSTDREVEMLILVTMRRVQAEDESLKASGTTLWDNAASDVEFRLND